MSDTILNSLDARTLEALRKGPKGWKLQGELLESELEIIGHAVIGIGGYADVYKARMRSDGKLVVAKVFREAHLKIGGSPEERDKYFNQLRREYFVWALLEHPNIIPLNGLVIHDGLPSPALVSDFKRHKDLSAFTRKNKTFDRLHMASAKGVACGLRYLHDMHVVHGDLAWANILVDEEKKDDGTTVYFPLITDFGKSRVLHEDGYTTQPGRQLLHQPPELLGYRGRKVATTKDLLTPASDVYSLALVILQLITDKVPYYTEGSVPWVALAIADNGLRPTPEDYPVLDESYQFCWDIMEACWKANQADRITSEQAHERLCNGSKRDIN